MKKQGGGYYQKQGGAYQKQAPKSQYKEEGYYDQDGFYIMKDGSFYDPQGRFFDVKGYDETGGYYDGPRYIPGKLIPSKSVPAAQQQQQNTQFQKKSNNQQEADQPQQQFKQESKPFEKPKQQQQQQVFTKEVKEEISKNQVDSNSTTDEDEEQIFSQEGARIRDICPSGKWCKDNNCIRYHPQWMQKYCYKFMIGECRSSKCPGEHKKWAELIRNIKGDQMRDIFTKQPFRKMEMFRIVPSVRRGGFRGPMKDYENERATYLQDIKTGTNRQVDTKATLLDLNQNITNTTDINQNQQFLQMQQQPQVFDQGDTGNMGTYDYGQETTGYGNQQYDDSYYNEVPTSNINMQQYPQNPSQYGQPAGYDMQAQSFQPAYQQDISASNSFYPQQNQQYNQQWQQPQQQQYQQYDPNMQQQQQYLGYDQYQQPIMQSTNIGGFGGDSTEFRPASKAFVPQNNITSAATQSQAFIPQSKRQTQQQQQFQQY
eukprot:403369905